MYVIKSRIKVIDLTGIGNLYAV